MADTQWLTQAQYDLLANELKERVEVKRVEIARLIDAARQAGDLRENGGYHAARNEQKFLLGSRDAGGDLGIQVFSAQAPLGAAVIGHKAGDKLSFEAPTGRMIEVEILDAKPFEG